jgi:hypothetical protein
MRNFALLALLIFAGSMSISASKSDMILGKWEIVKLVSDGRKKRDNDRKEWLEFRTNNVILSGKGDQPRQKREEWSYEDDKKKLYITDGGRQIEFDVLKLSKNKMVLKTNDRGRIAKISFKRMSE